LTTTTAPGSLVKKMCPSAAVGDAKCGPGAPVSRPCLIKAPVSGLSVVMMPLSFTM